MSIKQMKGFTCCGDCINYDWKKHKCKICKSIETDARRRFYDDCPLEDVEPVQKWIPVSERLPEEPKENPIFEEKKLELYLVTVKGADYPFRAFWNGKFFTDGWSKANVTAWMPLPECYKEEKENG